MAITWQERAGSRTITEGDRPAIETLWISDGSADDAAVEDEQEALLALSVASPVTFLGLPRDSIRVEPILGTSKFSGEVMYAQPQAGGNLTEQGQSRFEFDTGGNTQHITHSINTVQAAAEGGGLPPNYGGAIGVTDDGVEGVDITFPQFQWSEVHLLPGSVVTQAYRVLIFSITGTVNNGTFRGFPGKSVLFLGASGTALGDPDDVNSEWEITFRFAASPNRNAFTVDGIELPGKNGWDYLWVKYEDREDEETNSIVKRATAAYVEQVYFSSNFGLLAIPDPGA